MAEPVLQACEDGAVAWLTLNRPERLNALNPALVQALLTYFQALYRRPELRVVVLQGAGSAFCARESASWRTNASNPTTGLSSPAAVFCWSICCVTFSVMPLPFT